MKLTDEQIGAILIKESKSKTLIVDKNETEKAIQKHQSEGWKLLKQSEVNGRTKLTFVK